MSALRLRSSVITAFPYSDGLHAGIVRRGKHGRRVDPERAECGHDQFHDRHPDLHAGRVLLAACHHAGVHAENRQLHSAKWAIEAVEIAATGGTLSDIALPLAVLGLMAVILLAVGSAILRPSESGVGHGA